MTKIPFSTERLIRWGDCDPAGVVYTPRVLHFALEVIEDFIVSVVGLGWGRLLNEFRMGAPSVHSEIDYLRPLKVEQTATVVLYIERVGGASVNYRIEMLDEGGAVCFLVKHTSCYVNNDSFSPVAIPEDVKTKMLAYQEACR
ncbi:MAG: thioesterase family protein [Proteobacteria bacterium]|nr:thioesterase family protein [Pseudomonadota bacterium]